MKLKEIPHYTVVHTPTEEEAKELLAILHENGWKWIEDYGEEDDITYWDRYEHKTCYNLKLGKTIDTEEYCFYASEGYTILPFSAFERLYCEQEKPQPKFKVGDKVRIIQDGTVNPDDVDIVDEIESITQYIRLKNTDSNWFETCLEPYTEAETKPTEDMETKQLNLLEILKGCENETFYSPCFGELTLLKTDCDSLLFITARGVSERFNLDGRLWIAVSTGMPILFPSRALYEQYPLDPYTAWMKWQEEQKYHIEVIVNNHDSNGDLTDCAYVSGDIAFRTHSDRDKCIEEIKAIIEKYSKK